MSENTFRPFAIRGHVIALSFLLTVVIACSFAMKTTLDQVSNPGHVWSALTLDMVLVIPLAFYLLIVRPLRWPVVLVAPALALGFLAADRVIPEEHGVFLSFLKPMAVLCEICLVGWLFFKASRAFSQIHRLNGDPIALFEASAMDIVHSKRTARILASEVAVFYYGLSPHPKQHIPQGFKPIPAYVKSGHGGIAFATVFILLIEGAIAHLYLSNWSISAAWILTLLTAYSALWVIADYRAARLRPSLLGSNSIVFRAGLRWEVEVPRNLILSSNDEVAVAAKERLNLTFLGEPSIWIHLSECVDTNGPCGMRRRVRAIGLEPDKPLIL